MSQVYNVRNAIYQNLFRPLIFQLKPEAAHEVVITALRNASVAPWSIRAMFGDLSPAPMHAVELFGLTFPNPVGLAAGFDKNALAVPAWEALGFGFAELGTITALAQPGNPRPRVWRLPSQTALINRMGFNNDGADRVASRLQKLRRSSRWPKAPVGINIGKSKMTPLDKAEEDYLYSFNRLFSIADYFAINVSSPNTPGLRDLQGKESMNRLLGEVQRVNHEKDTPKPVLVKIAPDLSEEGVLDIVRLAEKHGLAGLIATNTTINHALVKDNPAYDPEVTQGGLSGLPLRQRSTDLVTLICSETKLPVIASGGITSPSAALEKLDAGARLVQLYTGFIYCGPALIGDINNALHARRQDGPAQHVV